MKSCLTFFLLLLCLNSIDSRAPELSFRCDYKYYKEAGGWFKHFIAPVTWFDARLRCILEGAVLVSPTTEEIKTVMMSMIQQSTMKQEIFTGIHASLSPGDYYTVDGVPLESISVDWVENEPDNKDNKENCITFNSVGELADRQCEDTRPYICYRSDDPPVPVNECGTVDPEYHLDRRTNKCYKFHRVGRNFSRAALACSAEGGHLAIINSDVEATVLKELFAKIPGNEIMIGWPVVFKDVAFVGFYDWGERGDWRTIYGQTLIEAGFNKFNVGEPNGVAFEFCGSIHRVGLLNDVSCGLPCTFICEKSPDYPPVCRVEQPWKMLSRIWSGKK